MQQKLTVVNVIDTIAQHKFIHKQEIVEIVNGSAYIIIKSIKE
jgi:hypothetical protein